MLIRLLRILVVPYLVVPIVVGFVTYVSFVVGGLIWFPIHWIIYGKSIFGKIDDKAEYITTIATNYVGCDRVFKFISGKN